MGLPWRLVHNLKSPRCWLKFIETEEREANFVSRITELGNKSKDQDSIVVLRQSQWSRYEDTGPG